jgi:hypothetical protein
MILKRTFVPLPRQVEICLKRLVGSFFFIFHICGHYARSKGKYRWSKGWHDANMVLTLRIRNYDLTCYAALLSS